MIALLSRILYIAIFLAFNLALQFSTMASTKQEELFGPEETLSHPLEKKVSPLSQANNDEVWILSVDGGGIRGTIPARVLNHIEKSLQSEFKIDVRISDLFQMVAGTSTGSLIVMGLTVPDERDSYRPKYPAESLMHLYESKGSTIFPHAWWREVKSLVKDKYTPEAFEELLINHFKTTRLHEAANDTHVLVPAYNLTKNQPHIFDSYVIKEAIKRRESPTTYFMHEVARASAAAPTYFPAALVNGDYFIDGGVFMNDPALKAYLKAKNIFSNKKKFIVVSLGTGEAKEDLPHFLLRGGKAEWAPYIPSIMMKGAMNLAQSELEDLQATSNGELEYYRIQAQLKTADLDKADPSTLHDLKIAADDLINNNITLKKVYEKLQFICQNNIVKIAHILSTLNTASEASFSKLLLRQADWGSIYDNLRNHTNLVSLNLRRTALTDDKLQDLCKALEQNSTLQRLDLSENGIGEKLTGLGALLDKNTTLRELYLRHNNIDLNRRGKDGIEALTYRKNLYPTSLIVLDIGESFIDKEGKFVAIEDFEQLIKAITRLNTPSPLQFLSLSKSQIKTGFIPHASEAQQWAHSLMTLAHKMTNAVFDFTENNFDEKITNIIKESSYNKQFKF